LLYKSRGVVFIAAQRANPGLVNSPGVCTGNTAIELLARLITGCVTVGAGAARVQPIAVGVEVVLDGFVANLDRIRRRDREGFVPGGGLHGDQFDVF